MPFTFISSAKGVGTTSSANTTGASLLVLMASYDSGATVSDNKGNTWTALTARNPSSTTDTYSRIWYCVSPTVGAGHTATLSISYGSIAMLAFSGVDTASPFEQELGNTGASAVTSLGVSSFTPTNANALVIFGAALGNGATSPTIDSGFTSDGVNAVVGTNYGVVLGYKIQTAAAAVAPTASWTSAARASAAVAVFKALAGGPATAIVVTGPSAGTSGFASTNFTVSANGTITGSVVVTPNDGGNGGTFSPTSVTISSGTPSATFTYTAASVGAKSISVTNNGGLSNPGALTYTATAPVGLTAAVVATNGQDIALTMSSSTTLTLPDVTVKIGGVIVYPVAITGAGTSWTVTMGRRWVHAGTVVTVTVGTNTVTATNSSIISTRSTKHVGRQFGMFVHWGLETWWDEEWSDGVRAADSFSPTGSITDAIDQWIASAQLAGMRYIVLTAKHHSGFCLWPSTSTTYDVASTTWYSVNGSPDIVALFTQRVRAAGLGVGIYFSPWDRKFERDNVGYTPSMYQAHIQTQLTELLTNYGPIDLMWFDGWNWLAGGGVPLSTLPYASVFTFARNLQPACTLIVNNHQQTLFGTGSDNASDLLEYEGGTVGDQTPSTNRLPAEECDTIRSDNAWFWKTTADTPLTASTLTGELARINGRSGSYLLNCPPNRSGKLDDAVVRVLGELGATRAEAITGATLWHGTGTQRTFSVALTTDGSTPAASLAGLKWAVYETPNPVRHERPIAQGIGATNGSGVLAASFLSAAQAGSVVWLVVTNSDGTVPAGTGASGFSGPVVLS